MSFIAIHKLATLKDDHLEEDAHSTSSCVDAINNHEEL
jgi:hypothetical protein